MRTTEDTYVTAAGEAAEEFVEKRSRFIGRICPVQTEADAQAFIAAVRKKHFDARHNVWAYILRDGDVRRYSDDGEPQGTAGIPVLDTLQKAGVTDCAVVVTRYFGGILLGGGGLVRAYSHTASLALAKAGTVTMTPCYDWLLHCDYTQLSRLTAALAEAGAVSDGVEYADRVTMRFYAPCALSDTLTALVTELTAGTVSCERGEKKYRKIVEN